MQKIKLLGLNPDADPDTVKFLSCLDLKFPMVAKFSGKKITAPIEKSPPYDLYYIELDAVVKISVLLKSFVYDFESIPSHKILLNKINAFWEKYCDIWSLKQVFEYTHNPEVRIYGWVDEITSGTNKGRFKFGYPDYEDNCDTIDPEDALSLNYRGICDTLAMAINAVLGKNHPIVGAWI
jgi:hypothetical protein